MRVTRGILLLIATSLCLSCDLIPSGTIKLVSSDVPPTLEISGTESLDWIWFQGPFQNPDEPGPPVKKSTDSQEVILWKIAPPGFKFIRFNEAPKIKYGELPSGWEQELPKRGDPPPLVDGYLYSVGVVAPGGGRGLGMCIFIKNGKALLYTSKNKDTSFCGS